MIIMKRRLIYGAAFLFVMFSMTSCEAIGDCKVCQDVKYENGVVISASPETQYCGTELINQESRPDFTLGSVTTKVECY
jgi:hypothetical protein